ncbi:MAG: peptidylprolyl isomerase [Candidatus Aenigmarchaeota archaeon]|nr:peptidylprolyl isomerase [Candidatus Aenigmarchaeota archaeon]
MNDGDFVKIDFVGRVKDTDEIFDLTIEDVAKKEGIYNPKKGYGPALVIVGKEMVIPGVDEQLRQMKVGDEKEFEVPKEKAFGNRDLTKIKIVSYSKFIKEKIEPVPGLFVDIDGREAKIQTVNGGRVRVDFNHPLAGKALKYRLKVVEEIKDTKEKASELVEKYGMNAVIKDTRIDETGKLTLVIEKDIPKSVKDVIKSQIEKYVTEVKDIQFELRPQIDRKNNNPEHAENSTGTNKV